MELALSGFHHLTAVTARAGANLAFYTRTLGLRLVKKTVNQDDTSAYHLFYADALASPGSDLTFFDWSHLPRERRGTHSISRTGLRVGGVASLHWWADYLDERGVVHAPITERDGRLTLDLEDPEGQRLSLIDDGGDGAGHPWSGSPIPAEHQIRGLGPVMLSVPDPRPTAALLTRVLHMRPVRHYTLDDDQRSPVQVYTMAAAGPAAELHVASQPHLPVAQLGAGGVHHVAFRAPDADYLHRWTEHLRAARVPSSGEVERYYFRSLYFREPNGILFEIATDGPGFATDEPLEHLGERLSLPPFLEPQRVSIERGLVPLG